MRFPGWEIGWKVEGRHDCVANWESSILSLLSSLLSSTNRPRQRESSDFGEMQMCRTCIG